jgi:hypothetical protein
MLNIPQEQIREKFVDSLMKYYKIDEDLFLRQHIAEMTNHIDPKQYRLFFQELSASDMPYKNPFEKIALIASKFRGSEVNESSNRAKYLYDIMYELRKNIILQESHIPAQTRFEAIDIPRIRDKKSNAFLLNAVDINVIERLSCSWIFNNVAGDKSHFLATVAAEYEKSSSTPEMLRES